MDILKLLLFLFYLQGNSAAGFVSFLASEHYIPEYSHTNTAEE